MNELTNIIDFIANKYAEAVPEESRTLADFISFAKKYLSETNKPVNMSYMGNGIGFILKHGEYVNFVTDVKYDSMGDEGIHVTRSRTIPGMHGVIRSDGAPVFGGE